MNLITIALKSLKQRWVPSFLTALSVALGVALMVAVLILNNVITEMFQESGSGYDLVVGPKGSDLQLVLSTIYRMDRPIENLPWRFYEELKDYKTVEHAIPMNLGDTTEVGDFPIVGTTPQFLLLEYAPGKKFRIGNEEHGLRGTWDAVIGSQVAQRNGWSAGSKFKMIHAGQDDHVHDEEFTVRGVLAPTGTPNDRTVFVHIDGFFQMSDHSKPVREAIEREAKFFGETEEEVIQRHKDDIDEILKHENESAEEHAHHDHGPLPDIQKEVTSILLVMKGNELQRANATMSMQTMLKDGFQAQGANTVQVMARLMRNLVGNIRLALLYLTALIIIVSGIGIFVSIYNSMSDRRREIAVMRALGARRQTVFSLILVESLLLCLIGGIGGLLLGHAIVFVAAPIIEARSGLLIDPRAFTTTEFIVIPVLIVMATLIGILPGLTAYRTDVAEGLQNS
ncbi:Macrolide export ATP-binding/permease protein MacB [Thalassoglobus neptunius]|uniref:Macrolide export ATP-binding/permease protein MacB n=1 Tax=Thalassoglobus neptunius TaxID=1938619 RepID=A0A5C5WYQ7_9PLAN|nr:ABC transporter permease [Thalassoglobus neptunius]TWT55826.1 Macrolide export ATP-binding/permease protein MacB [Thalassoglobus neptunius]